MLVPNKNPQGYKEHFISFIAFAFGEGVTIIDCLANMNLYVSVIEKSYKSTIIGHLLNAGTYYLLLHIVHCWSSCAVNEENQALPMFLYFSHVV